MGAQVSSFFSSLSNMYCSATVEETVAAGFLIEKDSICIYYKEKMSSEYYNAPLGKILFLTREAAEKALEGENNG